LKILRYIILTFFIATKSSICLGQVEENEKQCKICTNGVHSNEAPYQLSLRKELPFIISGTMLFTGSLILQNAIDLKPLTEAQIAELNPDNIIPFDRAAASNNSKAAARASDFLRTSITLLPLYFLSNHNNRKDFLRLFVMAGEVFTLTYATTSITKNLVQRVRPIAYNNDVPIENKGGSGIRRSFFSGHTSHTAALSFFVAKVMHDYHPNAKKGFKIG